LLLANGKRVRSNTAQRRPCIGTGYCKNHFN